jgi:hypothetical protein
MVTKIKEQPKTKRTLTKWTQDDERWLFQHKNDPKVQIYSRFPGRSKGSIEQKLKKIEVSSKSKTTSAVVNTSPERVQIAQGNNKLNVDLRKNQITIENGTTTVNICW